MKRDNNILLFPHTRILEASAEIFARRTGNDDAANEILSRMAGNPIPQLGPVANYNCIEPLEYRLGDIFAEMFAKGLTEYLPRILDEIERG